jgi:hypothetical protein
LTQKLCEIYLETNLGCCIVATISIRNFLYAADFRELMNDNGKISSSDAHMNEMDDNGTKTFWLSHAAILSKGIAIRA